MDDGKNDKKAKGTKICVIKKFLNLMIINQDYLLNNEIILKPQQSSKVKLIICTLKKSIRLN